MSDERLRELYEAGAGGGQVHVEDELWERLALGEVDESERERALEHISRCPQCAEVYRTLTELENEARHHGLRVPEAGFTSPRQGSRTWWLGLAAAAAIILLFTIPLWRSPPPSPSPEGMQLRQQTTSERPEPLAPIGSLPEPPHAFSWRALDDGWSYRVELLDPGAELLWESAPLEQSSVEWPAEVTVESGAEYYWRVLADPVGGGPAIESRLVSFSVR